jgi:hypothetical protein
MWLQELDRVQQLWQQQADQAGAQIQAALQQHVGLQCGSEQQQQHTGQKQQQDAPVRQLKQLMQQHKQELGLKVCLSAAARFLVLQLFVVTAAEVQ